MDQKQGKNLNIQLRLEQYIYEASIRLPFAAFITWVQLEIYRHNFDEAEDLINNYILKSTHLKDPQRQTRLKVNGNESDGLTKETSSEEFEQANNSAKDQGMNPA